MLCNISIYVSFLCGLKYNLKTLIIDFISLLIRKYLCGKFIPFPQKKINNFNFCGYKTPRSKVIYIQVRVKNQQQNPKSHETQRNKTH